MEPEQVRGLIVTTTLIAFIIILIFVFKSFKKEKEAKREDNKSKNSKFIETLQSKNFNITKKIYTSEIALFVDFENKLWSVKENNSSPVQIYNFTDLSGIKLLDYFPENVGRGFLSIHDTNKYRECFEEDCSYLAIKLKVNDSESSVKTLALIEPWQRYSRSSNHFLSYMRVLERMGTALAYILGISSAQGIFAFDILDKNNFELIETSESQEQPDWKYGKIYANKSSSQEWLENIETLAQKISQLEKQKIEGSISDNDYKAKMDNLIKILRFSN